MESIRNLLLFGIFVILLDSAFAKKQNGIKQFLKGSSDFTESFLYEASKSDPGVNAIYSPFSLLFLLAQLALYAKGNSEEQLLSVLHFKNVREIRSTIPNYLDILNSQQNITFEIAEKVYGNIQYRFSKRFERDTKKIFEAEAQNLDFSDSTDAAKTINDWVANITRNLIKDLVSPESLNSYTRLVLVNAIYFKGGWKYPFNVHNTEPKSFYVTKNKNVTVDMMNQVGTFNYADIDQHGGVKILELPYINSNFSFLVCLPKSRFGLGKLMTSIGNTTYSALANAQSKLKSQRVNVSIPTIKTTTTTDLSALLQKLNVSAIFDPNTAELSGMLKDDDKKQLYVSSAVQKATIIVNEEGSEAAAGNAIVVGVTAVMTPPKTTLTLNANHPFAYFILFKGTPIFSGVFTGQ